jgi:hypothetical protein
MYKTPTFAELQQYNRPFSTGQLSAFIIQTGNWDVAIRSERKNKKSCNKNAIKNTDSGPCINRLYTQIMTSRVGVNFFELFHTDN